MFRLRVAPRRVQFRLITGRFFTRRIPYRDLHAWQRAFPVPKAKRSWPWLLAATGVVMWTIYNYLSEEQIGSISQPFATKTAKWSSKKIKDYVGTPGTETTGSKALALLLQGMSEEHDQGLSEKGTSTDEALIKTFKRVSKAGDNLFEVFSTILSAEHPLVEMQLEGGNEHSYGMGLLVPGDPKLDKLLLPDLLLQSAQNFPGGFSQGDEPGPLVGLPQRIVLAKGDNVEILDAVALDRSGFKGLMLHFRTRDPHSYEGSLFHCVFRKDNGDYMIVRVGVGRAPTLHGRGQGVLDLSNAETGPLAWHLADLMAYRQLMGDEAVNQLLLKAEGKGTITNASELQLAHERMGSVAKYGGTVSRNVAKPLLGLMRSAKLFNLDKVDDDF